MFTVKRYKLQIALVAVAALLPILSGRAGAAPLPRLAPERVLAGPCAPGASYDASCDVDHDGDVDIVDIQLAAGHWGQAGTWTGGDYWSLTGNAGTVPGVHFLGTTDTQALDLRVGGQRVLRLEPHSVSPNLIGGYTGNVIGAVVEGGVIAGGGYFVSTNRVFDDFGSVGGGANNVAGVDDGYAQSYATVAGGSNNAALNSHATVAGGSNNTASGFMSTVSGGAVNDATGGYATVSGGAQNDATGGFATVAGGACNTASGYSSTIGGGENNEANRHYATVPGGSDGNASHYGELAYASGRFAAAGDAQTSLYVLRRETGDATLTELFLDGLAERITLPADRVMTFDILVVGSHRFGGGSSAGYQVAGVIRNIGGATSFVGTPIVTVLGENVAGWDVVVEANDTVDALVVKVQGSSGTTIRWVASVRTVEVGR